MRHRGVQVLPRRGVEEVGEGAVAAQRRLQDLQVLVREGLLDRGERVRDDHLRQREHRLIPERAGCGEGAYNTDGTLEAPNARCWQTL